MVKKVTQSLLIVLMVLLTTMSLTLDAHAASAPEIQDINYDANNGKLTLVIKRNNNSKTHIFLEKEDRTGFKDLGEKDLGSTGDTKEITLDIDAIQVKTGVTNIEIKRSSDNSYIELSWNDAMHTRKIYLKSGSNKSDEVSFNCSDNTNEEIYAMSNDGTKRIIAYAEGNDNKVLIPIKVQNPTDNASLSFMWDDSCFIKSVYTDDTLWQGKVVNSTVINKLLYTTKLPDIHIQLMEGYSDILVIENEMHDNHDTAWDIPRLSKDNTKLVKKLGNIEAFIQNDTYDINKLALVLKALDNYLGEDLGNGKRGAIIQYEFEPVRPDIRPAIGSVYIEIIPRNQEPITYNYSASETALWKDLNGQEINRVAGGIINIPIKNILSKCTDRETPNNISLDSNISNLSLGRATVDANYIYIDLTDYPTYYGVLSFNYNIKDAEGLKSASPGQVLINVTRENEPPKPLDISATMQLDENTKAISLNVENKTNVKWELDSISNIRFNGLSTTAAQNGLRIDKKTTTSNTSSRSYIQLSILDSTKIKEKDKLEFTYTIKYEIGGQTKTSSAKVSVEFFKADDPNDMEGFLYVHRKPLAFFSPTVRVDKGSKTILSIRLPINCESSYDLDHQDMHSSSIPLGGSRPNYSYNGLRAWEWSYKTLQDGNWTTMVFDVDGVPADKNGSIIVNNHGQNTTIDGTEFIVDNTRPLTQAELNSIMSGTKYASADAARTAGIQWIDSAIQNFLRVNGNSRKDIVISLRVRDIDGWNNIGEWSDRFVVTATGEQIKPVALFETNSSLYYVPKNGTFDMQITDKSFDSNGDKLVAWEWKLLDDQGNELSTINHFVSDPNTVAQQFATRISQIVNSSAWANHIKNDEKAKPTFKITLAVQEDPSTSDGLWSDIYSREITVYRKNEPPVVKPGTDDGGGVDTPPDVPPGPPKPPGGEEDPRNPKNNPSWAEKMKTNNAFLFEEDKGADGVIGDHKGYATNNGGYLGTPLWGKYFTVTDDQGIGDIEVSWTFTGNSVSMRSLWDELNKVIKVETITKRPGVNSDGTPVPAFTNTVTDRGYLPGAYKLHVVITDYPDPDLYGNAPSISTFWDTYGDKTPYHMYVVPSLNIETTIEVNDWELVRKQNNTKYVDTAGFTNGDVNNSIGDTKLYNSNTFAGYINTIYTGAEQHKKNDIPDYNNATNFEWIRVSDGKSLSQAGLEIDDVVPTLGDIITIKSTTNKYVTELYAQLPCSVIHPDEPTEHLIDGAQIAKIDGQNYEVIEMVPERTSSGDIKINLDGTINWQASFELEDIHDPFKEDSGFDLTLLLIRMYGVTNWGSETAGLITRDKVNPIPLWVLPVKLFDFRITEITDPNLSDDFNKYLSKLIELGNSGHESEKLDQKDKNNQLITTDGVLVHHLALDSLSMTEASEKINMSKGYSFYFKVNSKGMKKDTDQVIITPRVYEVNPDGSLGDALVGYIPGQTGKYIPYLNNHSELLEEGTIDNYLRDTYSLWYEGTKEHTLGSHSKIVINTDLREGEKETVQTWYGRYGVPSEAKFFRLGETDLNSLTEWKGDILITFEMSAYKKGEARYNYVEKKQWFKERSEPYSLCSILNNELNNLGKIKYIDWDMYDGQHRGLLITGTSKTTRADKQPKGKWQGTVILYNTTRSVYDDYSSNPIWRE